MIPGLRTLATVLDSMHNYLEADDPGPCFWCGNPTRFIELHFEGFLHPVPCADEAWADYDRLNREMGPPTPW